MPPYLPLRPEVFDTIAHDARQHAPEFTLKLWAALVALVILVVGCRHAPETAQPRPIRVTAAQPVPDRVPASTSQQPVVHRRFDELPAVDVPDLRFDYTPDLLDQACAEAQKTVDEKVDAIVAIPDAQRTFANRFNAYEQALADYADASNRLAFLEEVHPDDKVRAAAARCDERSTKHGVELGARRDVYQALKAYLDRAGKTETLDAIDRRLIMFTMRDFRRNGLALSDADRVKLVVLRSRLAAVATAFSANLANDTTSIEVGRGDLVGLSKEFVSTLANGKHGMVVVGTSSPECHTIIENARREDLRRREWLACNGRAADKNLQLANEAVKLRDEAAHLLGYKTHADFVTEVRMAKSKAAVDAFLDRLQNELRPGREALDARMLELKKADTHDAHAKLENWDWRYYMNEIRKADYSVDDEKIRAYFPADKVMAGMFAVYSTLFHVTFVEVKGAKTWADGVKLYEVHDAPGGRLLAKFYVDLFPRDGKFGHASSFPIVAGREVEAGYQIPLRALVVNFNPPEHGKSARLSLFEVETLFHEFGHIMHGSLTTARYASMAGSAVDADFAEAPSQMLENFVYEPAVLALISADPAHPGRTMPSALIERIVRARTFDAPVRYTTQVLIAKFDQYIHSHGPDVDVDRVWHDLGKSITGIDVDPAEHFPASFAHMMNGYDAGYYGYLWSKVFADDMFTRFAKAGVLDAATGRAYRDDVLAPGREQDPDVLLTTFLGRAPNEHAFLHLLGIEGDTAARPK